MVLPDFIQAEMAQVFDPAPEVGGFFLDCGCSLTRNCQLLQMNCVAVSQGRRQPQRRQPVASALGFRASVIRLRFGESGALSECAHARDFGNRRYWNRCYREDDAGDDRTADCIDDETITHYVTLSGAMLPVWRNGRRTGLKILGL